MFRDARGHEAHLLSGYSGSAAFASTVRAKARKGWGGRGRGWACWSRGGRCGGDRLIAAGAASKGFRWRVAALGEAWAWRATIICQAWSAVHRIYIGADLADVHFPSGQAPLESIKSNMNKNTLCRSVSRLMLATNTGVTLKSRRSRTVSFANLSQRAFTRFF